MAGADFLLSDHVPHSGKTGQWTETFRDYAGLAYAQNMRIVGISKREIQMNLQSDYGYTVGGIEHRTRELSERRARLCEQLAAEMPAKAEMYLRWAKEWREGLPEEVV
jgi:hypothetical protein